jgi:hypothetical protein
MMALLPLALLLIYLTSGIDSFKFEIIVAVVAVILLKILRI